MGGGDISLIPNLQQIEDFGEDHYAIAFARIENHYFMNAGWLEEGQFAARCAQASGHSGRHRAWSLRHALPLKYAWALSKRWTMRS